MASSVRARPAVSVLLTFLASCAIVLFCIVTFAGTINWSPGSREFADRVSSKLMTMPAQLDGQFVLQWGATLAVALCGAGLLYQAQAQRAESPSSSVTVRKPLGSSSAMTSMFIQAGRRARVLVRCAAAYQLPPVPFWVAWCGGLSVMDALLVSAWIALAVCYLWHHISSKFAHVSAALTPQPGDDFPMLLNPEGIHATLVNGLVAKRLGIMAKAFGGVLRILMPMLFYPISRSNVLAWLFRTEHSSLVRYHRWMGYGTIGIASLHGLLYAVKWGAAGTLYEHITRWEAHKRPNLPGLVSLMAGLIMCGASVAWVRRNFYWFFYYTHIIGFLVWTLFALMHDKSLGTWLAPGLVLYALDASFRMWQAACNMVQLPAADVILDDAIITLRLRWPKGAKVAAGQTVYVRCRQISSLQSHPFTLASVHSNDSGGVVSSMLHIKVQGQWTRALHSLAARGQGLRLQIEGPYESTLLHRPVTPTVVMIAGGIGITPLKGLLELYSHAAKEHVGKLGTRQAAHFPDSAGPIAGCKPGTQAVAAVPRVHLLWSTRTLCELQLLGADLLQPIMHNGGGGGTCEIPAHIPHGSTCSTSSWLQASLHYTGCETDDHGQSCHEPLLCDSATCKSGATASATCTSATCPSATAVTVHKHESDALTACSMAPSEQLLKLSFKACQLSWGASNLHCTRLEAGHTALDCCEPVLCSSASCQNPDTKFPMDSCRGAIGEKLPRKALQKGIGAWWLSDSPCVKHHHSSSAPGDCSGHNYEEPLPKGTAGSSVCSGDAGAVPAWPGPFELDESLVEHRSGADLHRTDPNGTGLHLTDSYGALGSSGSSVCRHEGRAWRACPGQLELKESLLEHGSGADLHGMDLHGADLRGPDLLSAGPSIRPLCFSCAVVVSSLGALGGLMLAGVYQEKGLSYAMVGVMQFVGVATGGIAPPLLFLLACKLLSMFRLRDSATHGHKGYQSCSRQDSHTAGNIEEDSEHSLQPCPAGIVVLPGHPLGLTPGFKGWDWCEGSGAKTGVVSRDKEGSESLQLQQPWSGLTHSSGICGLDSFDVEAKAGMGAVQLPHGQPDTWCGNGLDVEAKAGMRAVQVKHGRPDVGALLEEVHRQHAGELEIEVLVGGPESMRMEVMVVCQELSSRSWWGLRGPVMRFRAVAHQH